MKSERGVGAAWTSVQPGTAESAGRSFLQLARHLRPWTKNNHSKNVSTRKITFSHRKVMIKLGFLPLCWEQHALTNDLNRIRNVKRLILVPSRTMDPNCVSLQSRELYPRSWQAYSPLTNVFAFPAFTYQNEAQLISSLRHKNNGHFEN